MKITKYILMISMMIFTIVYAQSFAELEIDCDAGNAKACYEAGNLYSNQAYKEKNYDPIKAAHKVATFYKKSCELGYAQACTAYAMAYTSDQKKDVDKDMKFYLQKGCDAGDEQGCTMLKMMPTMTY